MVSSSDKTDHHDIAEIMLKVVSNIIILPYNMDVKTTVQANILDKTNHIQKYRKSETEYSVSVSCSNQISTILYRGVKVIVFNATFNNISVISWWSVLIGGENKTEYPEK